MEWSTDGDSLLAGSSLLKSYFILPIGEFDLEEIQTEDTIANQ